MVLDHPSLSRQHAAVCYNRLSREWVVLDLDSAHGTRADGKLTPKVNSSQHHAIYCGLLRPIQAQLVQALTAAFLLRIASACSRPLQETVA